MKKNFSFKKYEKVIVDNRVKKLQKMANEIINDVIERTKNSKDVNLRPFRRYSTAYGIRKKKQLGVSKPNLYDTPKAKGEQRSVTHMLDSITFKKIKRGIRVYFISTEQNDKAHGNHYKHGRKFFGTDRRQRARIMKRLSKW